MTAFTLALALTATGLRVAALALTVSADGLGRAARWLR